jgi:hypothetical protein
LEIDARVNPIQPAIDEIERNVAAVRANVAVQTAIMERVEHTLEELRNENP